MQRLLQLGVYVGEACRSLDARVWEHIDAWVSKTREASACVDHLLDHEQAHKRGSKKLLHIEDSYRIRIASEEMEIICHSNKNDVNLLNKLQQENIQ